MLRIIATIGTMVSMPVKHVNPDITLKNSDRRNHQIGETGRLATP